METIKEEKKADLEQLLNSLIEKGWLPRLEEEIKGCQIGESFYKRKFIEDMVGFYTDDRGTPQWLFTKSLREVCSKSSGLWQFVCKNGMIKNLNIERYWKDYFELDHIEYYQSDFQYWVLESSLKNENELEDFLLQNIKVEG